MHTRGFTLSFAGIVSCVLMLLGAACAHGAAGAGAHGGKRGIERAALPFRVLRAKGGQEVSLDAFLEELGGARAVCLGEEHPNPHDHWLQLHLLDLLSARARTRGVSIGLGME